MPQLPVLTKEDREDQIRGLITAGVFAFGMLFFWVALIFGCMKLWHFIRLFVK